MKGVLIPKIHEMLRHYVSFEQPQATIYDWSNCNVEIVIGALGTIGGAVTGSNISFIE